MTPTALAAALEEGGFGSLWVAEHLHIPRHPSVGDAALTEEHSDVMDPFVTLSAAATVTTHLKLGTAICLVIQRDTIQTAKPTSRCRELEVRFLGDQNDHSRCRRAPRNEGAAQRTAVLFEGGTRSSTPSPLTVKSTANRTLGAHLHGRNCAASIYRRH